MTRDEMDDYLANIEFEKSRIRFLYGSDEVTKPEDFSKWQKKYYEDLNEKHKHSYGNFQQR